MFSWAEQASPTQSILETSLTPNVHRKSDSREACTEQGCLCLGCAELGLLVLSLASSLTLNEAEECNVTYSQPQRETRLAGCQSVPCSCPYQMCLSLQVPTRKQTPDNGDLRTPRKQGFDPQYFSVVPILQSQELEEGSGA